METKGNEVQVAALYGALAKAQGEFTSAEKGKHVRYPATKGGMIDFWYADYETLRAATAPALARNGLSVRQYFETVQPTDGPRIGRIVTILAHQGGGSELSTIEFDPPQSIKDLGGHTTYLRRYAYQCALALCGEDAEENGDEQYQGKDPAINRDRSRPHIPQAKAEPKPEPKPEPKAEPKPEPKAEPKAEPKPEPKPEPKAEPKAEPKPEPKAEPKAEPKPGKYTEAQGRRLSELVKQLGVKKGWTRPIVGQKVRDICGCEAAKMTEEDAEKFLAYLETELNKVEA